MSSQTSNTTLLRGICPAPFFEEDKFSNDTGYVRGRVCAQLPGTDFSCCLPCPAAQWLYPENFYSMTRIPGFIALGSTVLCAFVLFAFLVLPSDVTKHHYLNTCLLLAIITLELGFAVPVLVKPDPCANAITPNDMSDSLPCALAGSFVVAGGCGINTWILARMLSMHLQICWDVTPKQTFFWCSQLLAWGVTAVLTAVSLSITGVSFRFGDYCHLNSYKALRTIWGPLIAFAGLALFLQAVTFIYCLKVYLQTVYEERYASCDSGPFTSVGGSSHATTARAVYRRVCKVLSLQWRSLLISIFVAVDVVFLSAVFVIFNDQIDGTIQDVHKILPWVFCIVESKGVDQTKCLPYANALRPPDSILIATLVLLSIIGIQASLLIGKWSMLTGWRDLFEKWRRTRKRTEDFVNLDTTYSFVDRNIALGLPAPRGEKYIIKMSKLPEENTTAFSSPWTASSCPKTNNDDQSHEHPTITFANFLREGPPPHAKPRYTPFPAPDVRKDTDIAMLAAPQPANPHRNSNNTLERPYTPPQHSFSFPGPRPASSVARESVGNGGPLMGWVPSGGPDAYRPDVRPGTASGRTGVLGGLDTTRPSTTDEGLGVNANAYGSGRSYKERMLDGVAIDRGGR